jgi:PilZ domain
MDRPSERRVRLTKEPWPERRASVRFPLTLEARYSVSHCRAPVETGSGQIIDLSSSGLRFAAQGPLEPGLKLDVAINWPVLLDGRVQLQLIVAGVVVWSSGTETALQIQRHEFRTRSVRLKAASPQESDGLSVAGVKDPPGAASWEQQATRRKSAVHQLPLDGG